MPIDYKGFSPVRLGHPVSMLGKEVRQSENNAGHGMEPSTEETPPASLIDT